MGDIMFNSIFELYDYIVLNIEDKVKISELYIRNIMLKVNKFSIIVEIEDLELVENGFYKIIFNYEYDNLLDNHILYSCDCYIDYSLVKSYFLAMEMQVKLLFHIVSNKQNFLYNDDILKDYMFLELNKEENNLSEIKLKNQYIYLIDYDMEILERKLKEFVINNISFANYLYIDFNLDSYTSIDKFILFYSYFKYFSELKDVDICIDDVSFTNIDVKQDLLEYLIFRLEQLNIKYLDINIVMEIEMKLYFDMSEFRKRIFKYNIKVTEICNNFT